MNHIPLAHNRTVLIDEEDYERLSARRWCMSGRYAASRIDGRLIYMHRFLMNASAGMAVDHINGNRLDNRKANLRFATQRQNTRNQTPRNQAGYKGVYFRKDTGKWQAKIMVDYKSINLGCFGTPEEGARVYDAAARLHFGEFARTNFPEGNDYD